MVCQHEVWMPQGIIITYTMKYVLLLSFYHKKYKDKTGELTIKINDRLIDIIKLDQNIGLKEVTMTTRDDQNNEHEFMLLRTSKMYYYEIEDTELLHEDRENKLSVSVKNDNNNYTNGFMTQSSLLFIEDIFFLPISLFDVGKIKKIHDSLYYKFWKNLDYDNIRNTGHTGLSKEALDSTKELYIDEYNDFDWVMRAKMLNKTPELLQEEWLYYKFHTQKKGCWPGIVHPLDYVYTNSSKQIPNYDKGTIGGSFEFSLPISKKHKIFAIRQKNYRGPIMKPNKFFKIVLEILKGSSDFALISKYSVDHINNFYDVKE